MAYHIACKEYIDSRRNLVWEIITKGKGPMSLSSVFHLKGT